MPVHRHMYKELHRHEKAKTVANNMIEVDAVGDMAFILNKKRTILSLI